MTSDASIINGAASEGVASSLQAFFTLVTGITIGFIYSWKISLVCLACAPFMMFAGVMSAKFQQGLSTSSDAAAKDANLLAGDAILNYKTVISFARQE